MWKMPTRWEWKMRRTDLSQRFFSGRPSFYICMILLLSLCACAGGLSPASRALVTFHEPFTVLARNPERYLGAVVLAGGRVIETIPSSSLSEILVLQIPLGGRDEPADPDRSEGRFIIRSKGFLDPEVYPPGTLLTVVGRVTGGEYREIGGYPYLYPVLDPIEIKTWQAPQDDFSNVFFSFGIGTSF